MKHQADVGALSSQVMLQPVSVPLQNGFRFFRHLTPVLYQRALRFRLPVYGQRYGVSVFRAFDCVEGLGPLFPPAEHHPCRITIENPNLSACLLAQACQSLWLVKYNDGCKCSLMLTMPSDPSPMPDETSSREIPSQFTLYPDLSGHRSIVRRAPYHHGCTMTACRRRVPITEYWVLSREAMISPQYNRPREMIRGHTLRMY
jgi:hypothetical protein